MMRFLIYLFIGLTPLLAVETNNDASQSIKNKMKGQKISIKSDGGMKLNDQNLSATFSNNVVMSMGNVTMTCDELHIFYKKVTEKKRTPKLIQGLGQVYFEDRDEKIKAWCDQLDYKYLEERIFVSSQSMAKLFKDQQSFEAKSFDIDLKTSELNVQGSNALEIQLD